MRQSQLIAIALTVLLSAACSAVPQRQQTTAIDPSICEQVDVTVWLQRTCTGFQCQSNTGMSQYVDDDGLCISFGWLAVPTGNRWHTPTDAELAACSQCRSELIEQDTAVQSRLEGKHYSAYPMTVPPVATTSSKRRSSAAPVNIHRFERRVPVATPTRSLCNPPAGTPSMSRPGTSVAPENLSSIRRSSSNSTNRKIRVRPRKTANN